MTKLKFISLLLLGLVQVKGALAQPILNERYGFEDETNVVFSSVVSTDSCYYVVGVHTSALGLVNFKSSFTKFSLDGTISMQKEIAFDTLGIGFWFTNELIPTLDGNFAQMAVVDGGSSETAFMFLKLNPNGDTISTNYIYDFYSEREEFAITPRTLLQDSDSSYYGVLYVQRESDLIGITVFYKLNRDGDLILNTPLYPPEHLGYHSLRAGSLVKENDSVFVIGGTLIDVNEIEMADIRRFGTLIRVDKNGNLINEFKYYEDTLNTDINGLIKTADNGFLYCGRVGKYFEHSGGFHSYAGRVVKLNEDFEVEWKLKFDNYKNSQMVNLSKILPINDTEFLAVGYGADFVEGDIPWFDNFGWLFKFNIEGELLWERKYSKVPHFTGETTGAWHKLYDVEFTPDSGFVMVGESFNFHENEEPIGEMGWIVKTDKFGCIVPRCQLNDISSETIAPSDIKPLEEIDPPHEEPITWLYPNPTSSSIFYYHHQDEFKGGTAYIYSSAGKMVQKWEITENDITYEVDVSHLAVGSYVLKVFNMFGEAIETERFVKQ